MSTHPPIAISEADRLSLEILDTTDLKLCAECQTRLGEPVVADDEKKVFKCPQCRREFTQYLTF